MIHDEPPNDEILIRELRDSLSELTLGERPSLAAIVDRGRKHRRRQRSRLATIGLAAIAAGGALTLGLTSGHAKTPGTATPKQSAVAVKGTIRTPAFTLVSYKNGTDKLTLTRGQVFDATVLRHALAHDDIPALVKSNIYCSSDPAPPDPSSIGVLSWRPHLKPGVPLAAGGLLKKRYSHGSPRPDLRPLIEHTVTVIDPAKLPSGTELFFEYAPGEHLLFAALVYTKSYTCRSGQPPAQ